jgi:aryl-alcohol dehydrogenase-like predicted oxidoreductase
MARTVGEDHTAMAVRQLGTTGLMVTPIGLGLAAVGRPAYIDLGRAEDLGSDRSVAAMEQRSHQLLDTAYEAGVRYFDAARSYGFAEAFLASWLKARGLPADSVTVGSKWGYAYTAGWRLEAKVQEVKDHSVEALRRQLAESRAVLNDWLDLYQIHSATLESRVLEDQRVLSELADMRREGLVIGLTVSGPRQAEVIRRAVDLAIGVNPFQSVQATWNLLEPSAGEALEYAHSAGWGVVIKEALANGRLTSRNLSQELRTLEEVARERNAAVDAIAIAAALSSQWVDVVLSGAATVEQLQSNLRALTVSLTTEDLARLATMAEAADTYWTTRSKLPWS